MKFTAPPILRNSLMANILETVIFPTPEFYKMYAAIPQIHQKQLNTVEEDFSDATQRKKPTLVSTLVAAKRKQELLSHCSNKNEKFNLNRIG